MGLLRDANAGIPPPHPMALVVFMMGLPVFPRALAPDEEDADASDPFGYLDFLDSNSVDEVGGLERGVPSRIKERFNGWVEVGSVMRGGGVYKDIGVDAVF
jgi:hypothetical protein